MGRRLPRRVWHTVAALVPLPLIGLGYVAAVPGNPVAFQVELLLLRQRFGLAVDAQGRHRPHSPAARASYLFRTGGKGPARRSVSRCPTPSPPPASSSSPRALAATRA